MNNYIYLAKERIDTLYDSLSDVAEKIYSSESSATVGVAGGKVGYQEKRLISTTAKLEKVLNEIQISNIYSDSSTFIKASMPMSWNSHNKITETCSSTFWIGSDESAQSDLYSSTIILLIGSGHNIVGNIRDSGNYFSTSYIDAFFRSYEERLELNTLTIKDMVNNSTVFRVQKYIEAIEKSQILSQEKKLIEKRRYLDSNKINQYITELQNYYVGNYCEYDFVAQMLYSNLGIDEQDRIIRYLIAAPLFVSRRNVIGKRIVNTPKGKKYLLSKSEFETHKKHDFSSLHQLLIEEKLYSEEIEFTNEMKQLFVSMGSHKLFRDKRKREIFISNALPIVDKYFCVSNNGVIENCHKSEKT